MEHEHNHEHIHKIDSLNGVFIVSIILNLAFVAVEAGVGFWQESLGLISDAGHNLSDVFSLVLAMIAFRLAKVHSTRKFTFGYKKSTVLISLLNAIILLVAVGAIVIESIHKFSNPSPINGAAVSWTAGVGILVNGITTWLLMKNQKHDLNVRGAFLHMAADTLVSIGVLASGVIISLTGFSVIDPIVSLVIAAVILVSTWNLLSESLRLSLDGTPKGIDMDKVEQVLSEDDGVRDVHHVHVWAISTTEVALTAHLVLAHDTDAELVKRNVKRNLSGIGITHATLETEPEGAECHSGSCD